MVKPTRRGARVEEGEKTRQEILRVALDLFARQGYAKTTISQISEAAHTYRSSVDWHFGGKEGLLLAVMKYYLEEKLPEDIGRLWAEYQKIHPEAQPDKLMTEFYLYAIGKLIGEHLSLIVALFTLTFEQIHHNPKLARQLRQFWNNVEATLENGVRTGQQMGQFPEEIDPLWTAKSIVAISQGMFMQWYIHPEAFKVEEAFQSIADASMRLLGLK